MIQPVKNIEVASKRISSHLHRTPIIRSEVLNDMLQANIYFKADCLQKTGAFKVRGVLNHLLVLKEEGRLPENVVGYSTGNHGIGLAFAAKELGIKARIYLPKDTAPVKQRAAEYYGAEVIYTDTRQEAEDRTKEDSQKSFYYMHPSDSDYTIAGAGTICFEALEQMGDGRPDAIFASCGGGGLLSGSYLAKELLSPESLLIGSEPKAADDAYRSIKSGSIIRFDSAPDTYADGLKTLGVSARAFEHLQKLDDFCLVDEERILYWTAWLIHLLKIVCEPSCALNMETILNWRRNCSKNRPNILMLISGGNIDPILYRELWRSDYLGEVPKL
jgi:threonine dehydratase